MWCKPSAVTFGVLAVGTVAAILQSWPGQQAEWGAGVMQHVREKHPLCTCRESSFHSVLFGHLVQFKIVHAENHRAALSLWEQATLGIRLVEADCWRAGSTTISHMLARLGACFSQGQEEKKKDLLAMIQLQQTGMSVSGQLASVLN